MHTMASNCGEVLTDAEIYQNLRAMNYWSFFIDIGYHMQRWLQRPKLLKLARLHQQVYY